MTRIIKGRERPGKLKTNIILIDDTDFVYIIFYNLITLLLFKGWQSNEYLSLIILLQSILYNVILDESRRIRGAIPRVSVENYYVPICMANKNIQIKYYCTDRHMYILSN